MSYVAESGEGDATCFALSAGEVMTYLSSPGNEDDAATPDQSRAAKLAPGANNSSTGADHGSTGAAQGYSTRSPGANPKPEPGHGAYVVSNSQGTVGNRQTGHEGEFYGFRPAL